MRKKTQKKKTVRNTKVTKKKISKKKSNQISKEKKLFQNSRVKNMIRDAERYALVEFVNTPEKIMFSLINMKVNKHRKVYVK